MIFSLKENFRKFILRIKLYFFLKKWTGKMPGFSSEEIELLVDEISRKNNKN